MTMGVQKCCVLHAPEMGCAVDSEGNYVEEPSLKLPDGYIVGTVGAGDSFCAGILYSIYKKLSMDEALKIARHPQRQICQLGTLWGDFEALKKP